jgi:hypothetical protein
MASAGHLDDDTPHPPASLRSAWMTWLLATVALALYAFCAEIEARVESIPLLLTPGGSVEIAVPRLFSNPLELDIELPCPPAAPTLARPPALDGGLLKLKAEPVVRLEVSDAGGESKPVVFESMPGNGTCAGPLRRLTTNLAIAPGVYRWPPPAETPSFMLGTGFNQVRIKVAAAEPPLSGRRTVLYAPGSIQLATSQPNVDWLWPALYLDLLFPVTQAIWLLVLIRQTLRRRRGGA